MYVYVVDDPKGIQLELRDADNFVQFQISIDRNLDRCRADAALQAIGRVDGEGHAWLDQQAIVKLSGGRSGDPVWQRSFAAMVDYATSKGWVDETGAIRAHIERDEGEK